jgi:hypothetical protein
MADCVACKWTRAAVVLAFALSMIFVTVMVSL